VLCSAAPERVEEKAHREANSKWHQVQVGAKRRDGGCEEKWGGTDFFRFGRGGADADVCAQQEDDVDMDDSDEELDRISAEASKAPVSTQILGAQPTIGSKVGEWFVERSQYIPLRLTYGERKYLRLLEAALQVSEYTDKIDTLGFGLSKPKRIVHQIRELCAILSGLVLAADYKQGQELFTDRDFQSNADFYQTIFELGRRHKIMNPDKMRTTYGKLIYLLQVSSALHSLRLYKHRFS